MGKHFYEHLLHGVLGLWLVFQVFERHTQQQCGIALQQIAQPLVIVIPAVSKDEFFVGEGGMWLCAGQMLYLCGCKLRFV